MMPGPLEAGAGQRREHGVFAAGRSDEGARGHAVQTRPLQGWLWRMAASGAFERRPHSDHSAAWHAGRN